MWPFKKKKDIAAELEQVRAELVSIKNDISVTDSQAFKEMFLGGGASGRYINQEAAMCCSAVFACVRLISGAIASAPVRIYKRGKSFTRNYVETHPFQSMLGLRPNDHITASTFWKTMATQKVLCGNAYAPIVRGTSGRPTALIPIRASRVEVYQAWELGLDKKLSVSKYRMFYAVSWDDGTVTVIDQDDMLHVPNIGWNGKQGMSTIKAGAQSMGLALAAEESASKIFENGMVSQLALTYPNKLNADAQEKLREHLANRHGGSANHHKPLILTEGGDVKTMSMNADDAQLIQSRQFSVIDIARFFGVPPVMIGETEKTSSFGAGVEQMARWFVSFTMNDHLTDIEQEIGAKLFRNSDFFAEFDETELTRGDTKTRAEYYKAAIGSAQQPGWMTPNEVRSGEGMQPIDDGDALFIPKHGDNNDKKPIDTTV
jgi:HK97 family phage portal protein